MKRDEADRLLGGYAAGNLTREEREELCRAALENQTLFDALAHEEPFRELLADPAARAQLLRDLREDRPASERRIWAWVWRPAVLAVAGSAAGLILMVSVIRYAHREPAGPTLVAQAPRPQAEVLRTPPAAAPAPPPATTVAKRAAPVERSEEPPQKAKESSVPPAPAAVATEESAKALAAPAVKRADALGKAEAPEVELSCSVLKKDEGGSWLEASAGGPFRAGEQVRLRILPAESGFVTVAVRDGDDTALLTPARGAAVKAGEPLLLPAEGALKLAGTSGGKSVRISFSTVAGPTPVGGFGVVRSRAVDEGAVTERQGAAAKPARVIELHLVYGPQ